MYAYACSFPSDPLWTLPTTYFFLFVPNRRADETNVWE